MPDGLKTEGADQGVMKKLFLPRFEMFPERLEIVGGERHELLNGRPVPQVSGPDNFNPEGHVEANARGTLFLVVVMSGKEKKRRSFETAFGRGFAETRFAEKENLLSFADGRANRGEFFKP